MNNLFDYFFRVISNTNEAILESDNFLLYFIIVVFLSVMGMLLSITMIRTDLPLTKRWKRISNGTFSPGGSSAKTFVREESIVVKKLLTPLGKLAIPKDEWRKSLIRKRMVNAGFRTNQAVSIFYGIKAMLTLLFPGLLIFNKVFYGKMSPQGLLFFAFLLAALGYYLPTIYLRLKTSKRQKNITNAFPDALDLMVVCVEAGLGLDAAILRVGEEMKLTSKALAEEFYLLNLELRTGKPREVAMKNLAWRTGVEDVESLVTMLIQADRFGTSIAQSLRVHSDVLRTKRQLRAEEKAAKIPVKLIFPLALFIFPSLFIVILGPAIIAAYRTFVQP
jgi:tight adherence protein C